MQKWEQDYWIAVGFGFLAGLIPAIAIALKAI
jgi:hypothetical protein